MYRLPNADMKSYKISSDYLVQNDPMEKLLNINY